MTKPILHISTGRENSDEENRLISESFGKNFKLEINQNCLRCSDGDLPMIIYISIGSGLATSVIYDFLKFGIKHFFSGLKRKRGGSIVIRESSEEYIFSKNSYYARKQARDTKFESVDDLIDYLKSQK